MGEGIANTLAGWEEERQRASAFVGKANLLHILFDHIAETMGDDPLEQAAEGLCAFFEEMGATLSNAATFCDIMMNHIKTNGNQEAGAPTESEVAHV